MLEAYRSRPLALRGPAWIRGLSTHLWHIGARWVAEWGCDTLRNSSDPGNSILPPAGQDDAATKSRLNLACRDIRMDSRLRGCRKRCVDAFRNSSEPGKSILPPAGQDYAATKSRSDLACRDTCMDALRGVCALETHKQARLRGNDERDGSPTKTGFCDSLLRGTRVAVDQKPRQDRVAPRLRGGDTLRAMRPQHATEKRRGGNQVFGQDLNLPLASSLQLGGPVGEHARLAMTNVPPALQPHPGHERVDSGQVRLHVVRA